MLAIEPELDSRMSETSLAYRVGRGPPQAIKAVETAFAEGLGWTVDADIKSYFDTIWHRQLMTDLAIWIDDERILRLVLKWLRTFGWRARGVAQGAPISPLLANLYLHPVDRLMATTDGKPSLGDPDRGSDPAAADTVRPDTSLHDGDSCDPGIFASDNQVDQSSQTLPANGFRNAEFCEVGSDRISHSRTMLDQHRSGSMQDKNALLVDGLDIREPHVRPGNGLADRFCIRLFVLLCLHVRLDVCGRHQPNIVPHRSQCAGPTMSRCTSFDSNQARLQLGEEHLDLGSAKLAAENPMALGAHSVGVKTLFAISRPTVTVCIITCSSTYSPRTLSVSGWVDAVHSIRSGL